MNSESIIETYILPYVKEIAGGSLLYDSGSSNPMLCDDLEGWGEEGCEVGGRFEREGAYSCLWLIHVDIWQKPTQYCKAIIFQLKINTLKF